MQLRKLALCASFASLFSCGDNGETVFLYFIHAYAGSENASMIGDTGPVVNNAKFGERHGNDGSCAPGGNPRNCLPIEYNRQLGGDFQMILDGQPTPSQIAVSLVDMYPQETGTAVLVKRTGDSSSDVQFFRHIQSISSTCTLTMVNGLSLANNPSDLTVDQQYSMIPEFTFGDLEFAGYLDESQIPIPTECGNLPIDDPRHLQFARTDLASRVAESPWFLPNECKDDDVPGASICFNWGPPIFDGRSFIEPSGEALVERTTREYYNCLQDVFTFNTQDMMAMMPTTTEQECPAGPLTWDDVSIDTLAAQECREAFFEAPFIVEPSEIQSFIYFDERCDTNFRARTPGQDVIFEDRGDDELIETNRELEPGSELFWVLFGRPVNPLLWTWDSANQIANLDDFPYFNAQNQRIGEYDD